MAKTSKKRWQEWHTVEGEIAQLIEDCENRSERLSDWESGFIDSISLLESISDTQLEKLEAVWHKVTESG